MIRVLVVEDSTTVRRALCDALAEDPAFEIVGEAGDGQRAIALCLEKRPDVVTMDMMLPVMSGLSATEYIMAHCPTPILVVSASTNRGELFKTYEALAAGAVDVLEKPKGSEPPGAWEQRFRSAVRIVSKIRVITHPRARLAALSLNRSASPMPFAAPPDPRAPRGCELVAIGASTGGPGAILQILRGLPRSFDVPVAIVLHIGAPFGGALADWLDGLVDRRVGFATEGRALASARGEVLLAPADRHLVLSNGAFRFSSEPERHSCRPSVDVLFESVARELGPASAGFLLTGMGKDGAKGLLDIRHAGGVTVAQDEATSVVYGMPREAEILGAAQRILPLPEIALVLAALKRPREPAP